MLFNSLEFILLFLPVTLALYAMGGRMAGSFGARAALLAASLFFYSWWDIRFLPILLGSGLVNYSAGLALEAAKPGTRTADWLLAGSILINVLALGYFKYIAFVVIAFNDLSRMSVDVPAVLLPLGISFFTFHQITYLVHVYRTGQAERNPVRYGLFVAFFPQLLAGPITYAREMLPQLSHYANGRLVMLDVAVGLTIFGIGLVKKVVLADSVAPYADIVFGAASKGLRPSLIEAWFGVLAYAFQIYFDFSGYSDMAIGLSRMFGIRLPLNFHSPYKATSIIEFWRRWHISLSRFLRDYLYIPLGGNRAGVARWLANLLITMLLGGLWHGAGWTFMIWGGLHGVYLAANHLWRRMTGVLGMRLLPSWLAGTLTFTAICLAWVYFRADNISAAHTLLRAMAGEFGAVVPADLLQGWPAVSQLLRSVGISLGTPVMMPDRMGLLAFLGCAAIVWLVPNTQEIIGRYSNAIDPYRHLETDRGHSWQWRPSRAWGTACALAIAASLLTFERPARFLYFQF